MRAAMSHPRMRNQRKDMASTSGSARGRRDRSPMFPAMLTSLAMLTLVCLLSAYGSAMPLDPATSVGLTCVNATPAKDLLKGTFCESFVSWRIFVNESASGDVAARAAQAEQAYLSHIAQLGDVRAALPPSSGAIKLDARKPTQPRTAHCYSLLAYYEWVLLGDRVAGGGERERGRRTLTLFLADVSHASSSVERLPCIPTRTLHFDYAQMCVTGKR